MFRLCHCLANTAQWSRRGGIGIDVTWEMHVRFGRVPASSQKDLSISAAKQRLWGEVLAVLKISPNLRKQALRRLTECFRLEMSAFPYFLVLSREIAVSVMPFTICLTAHWFRSKEIFERFLFLFFFFCSHHFIHHTTYTVFSIIARALTHTHYSETAWHSCHPSLMPSTQIPIFCKLDFPPPAHPTSSTS